MPTSPAITRQATALADTGTAQITNAVGHRITLAFLQDGDAQKIALDFNARLVTELREQGVWPTEAKPKKT